MHARPCYMFEYGTTKKQGYPSVFKSTGIAPKSAGIGLFFLSWRFFSRRFKPPSNECGNRATKPVTTLLKARFKTYTSTFESVGIGLKSI